MESLKRAGCEGWHLQLVAGRGALRSQGEVFPGIAPKVGANRTTGFCMGKHLPILPNLDSIAWDGGSPSQKPDAYV